MVFCGRRFQAIDPPLLQSVSTADLERTEPGTLRNAEPGFCLFQLTCGSLRSPNQRISILLYRCIRDRTPRLNRHGVSRLHNLLSVFSSSSRPTQPVSTRGAMLRQILLNSTNTPDLDLVLMAQSSTHAPSSLNASHGGSVSVAALLRPIAGRGAVGLREGELHKPDLITYIVMCLLLFLLVLLIVFFINCQLRNSFFASMPYDRSLREARTSYK
ncbi:hypothetical protein PFLUV_G00123290 [Perca fluviatilis]|uniref:Small integral membrane protein 32 n=1 Tax=Perca fluviatilis TaxID=8168 RepID=A0A6A5F1W4_PERFL|nr:uncharacterized protein LOC120566290 [Perca fluviatilis]KAF1384739.1 hypothetical protein PFLUV_G00123290 [Perca fluviatilis]